MILSAYSDNMDAAWDDLVDSSWNGTFLHTRKFLSYHGDRFEDASLIINDEKGRLRGVLPAAYDFSDNETIISHPGITYGGLVHAGKITGENMLQVLMDTCRYFKKMGCKRFVYKSVPHVYHTVPSQDDLYAFFRMKAVRFRCDLSSCIDLGNRPKKTKGRKSAIKKAIRKGVVVSENCNNDLSEFWEILNNNLYQRHGVTAVHSLDEIRKLILLFPEQIKLVTVKRKMELLGGCLLFLFPNVVHTQYIATSNEGARLSAGDVALEHAIENAALSGIRFFDYGNSNENSGWTLNAKLHSYKKSFGSGGVVNEFYEIDLEKFCAS